MKPLLAAPVCALLLATTAAGASPEWAVRAEPETPDSPAVERAWKVLSAGLTEEGLALMKKAAEADPGDVLVQRHYQIAMRNAGRYTELKAEFEKRLAENPKDARAHLLAAELEPRVERYKDLVRRGVKLAPRDPWLASSAKLLPVFEKLAKGGRPADAIAALEAYPSAPRNLALYRGALFNAYLSADRFEDANRVARALIGQYPRAAQGWVLLAFSAAAEGKEDAALEAIEKGLAIRDAVDLRVLRGQILWARGEQVKALDEFDRAARSPKDDSCWECAMIVAYGYLGRYEEAAALAPKAFADRPWDVSVRASAATSMLRAGKLEEAIAAANSILKLRPNEPNANVTLGIAASLQGRHEDAYRFLSAAMPDKNKDPAIRAVRAVSLFHLGRQREGLEEVTLALLDAPTRPEVLESAETVAALFEQADVLFARLKAEAARDSTRVEALASSALLYARRYWFRHARTALKEAFDRADDEAKGSIVKTALDLVDRRSRHHRETYPLDHDAKTVALSPGGVDPRYPLLYVVDKALWVGLPWRAPPRRLWIDDATADARTMFEWSGDGGSVFISSGGVTKISLPRGISRPLAGAPPDGETIRLAYSGKEDLLTRLVERTVDGAPKLELEWIHPETGKILERVEDPSRFPGRFTTAGGKWAVEHLEGVFRDPELSRVNLKTLSERPFGIHGSRAALSPNGKRLAFVYQGREIRIFDLSSGELSSLVFEGTADSAAAPLERIVAEGPIWDPDGRHLFASVLDRDSFMSVVVDLKKKTYWRADSLWTHASWGPVKR
jgi:tetratricopeptide (TPR) repeat protein